MFDIERFPMWRELAESASSSLVMTSDRPPAAMRNALPPALAQSAQHDVPLPAVKGIR